MFAEAKVDLPRGVGTSTPAEVAEGVVRGIEQGKDELTVAPVGMKVLTRFSEWAPVISGRIQRRLPASDVSDAVARGQVHKR
jgi:hypothetical protein